MIFAVFASIAETEQYLSLERFTASSSLFLRQVRARYVRWISVYTVGYRWRVTARVHFESDERFPFFAQDSNHVGGGEPQSAMSTSSIGLLAVFFYRRPSRWRVGSLPVR